MCCRWKKAIICTRCYAYLETKTIPKTGKHSWKDNIVFQRPTCKSEGCIQQVCRVCGETRMRYPSKLKHDTNGSHWQTISKATCTKPEKQGLRCTKCGDVMISKDVGKPLGHQYEKMYDELEEQVYDYCPICKTKRNKEKATEFNIPINGELKEYYVYNSLSKIWFSGEINPKNFKSAQFLKPTSNVTEGTLKLDDEEQKADLKKHGIKINFSSDGSHKAYLYYTNQDDIVNQALTDGELEQNWHFYAYVKYNDGEMIFYPASTGNYENNNGKGTFHDLLHSVKFHLQ